MSGYIARATSSSPTVPMVGSVDPARHTAVVLMGRDAGCAVSSWCRSEWHQGGARPALPTSVRVSVIVPWTSGITVHLAKESFQPGSSMSAPSPGSYSGLSIRQWSAHADVVTFTITGFDDGAAYNAVLSGT